MTAPTSRQRLTAALQTAAAAYQNAHVIQHCAVCSKPCCHLETHVLELNWQQVKVFWQREESRAAFDRLLSSGIGPEEIREGDGLYYAYRKPCPAYDETLRSCKVYGQALKPVGCTDFPVYEDEGTVIADLRCEAVNLAALTASIAAAIGPEYRIVQSANEEFPFLVSLAVRRVGKKAKQGRSET